MLDNRLTADYNYQKPRDYTETLPRQSEVYGEVVVCDNAQARKVVNLNSAPNDCFDLTDFDAALIAWDTPGLQFTIIDVTGVSHIGFVDSISFQNIPGTTKYNNVRIQMRILS